MISIRHLTTALILTASLGAAAQKTSKEQLPAGFSPATTTLLVEHIPEKTTPKSSENSGYDAWTYYFMRKNGDEMEKYLQKNYPYKYQLATQKEIYTDSAYNDAKTYRYALVATLIPVDNYMKYMQNGQWKMTNNQPIFQYYIFDRVEKITYAPLSKGSSLVMWAFKQGVRKASKAE
ncbi:hypothetical protein EPD60_05535 [Flaviaesturariibacter flavus]|uniref:DUF4136 domain-containing protein n=1 Tax=Flaviaesturariibacter flavus TaxID=2502780 RepID=A0A4R1BJX4_9BACT|nr:hypothetical protein [Flaviaesturariibacter flavus]TCJ17651.1 hypothetical protein EPD60_05535 [Flaviaesturariibacter flavus]